MNKELQEAYKQKEAERIKKERETLRDMFAMSALGSLIIASPEDCDDFCAEAYLYADNMLKARGD